MPAISSIAAPLAIPPIVAPPAAPAPPAASAPPAAPLPAAISAPLAIGKKNPEAKEIEIPSKRPEIPSNHAVKKSDKKTRSGLIPALLALVLLVGCGALLFFFGSKELMNTLKPPAPVQVPGPDPKISEANYIRIGWQKDAYEILKNYMAATTSQGKLPFILNSETLATRVEDFYGGGMIVDSDTPADAFSIYELNEEDRKRGLFMLVFDQPPQFEMKEFFRPLASMEVQYGVDEADLLLSTVARVGNFAMEPLRVHAFFKRTAEGLKLDWEVFAQTKYRTFQNFVELPEVGHSGVFRIFVVEDVPEKGHSVSGTRTYRLADPANTSDTARVNVPINSEISRALSIINWRGTKENKPITRNATVELKWAGDESAPQLEISRFICWEFLGLGGQDPTAPAAAR